MGRVQELTSVNSGKNNSLDSHLFVAAEQPQLYGFEGTFFQQSTLSLLTSLPSAIIFSLLILSLFQTQEHFVSLFLCLFRYSPHCLNSLSLSLVKDASNVAVALISIIIGCLSNYIYQPG